MRGNLSNDIVSVKIEEGSKKPIALNEKSFFGKIEADTLNLSVIEACYLLEKGRLDVFENDEKCSVDYLIEILRNHGLYGNYIVYRDLKDRGYIIKTGFKYGSDFRLYDRGRSPGKGHSDYLVKVVFENYDINVLDFASYIRVAHGVNKNLLLAIVDDDFDITYYNVEWTRP
ncbi:tRNA-intron lyase [Methanobrevibacter woesei]|uniref:tRNA-intron lyase n=1 Tax=Methanobrevibacter woesei TaxID=190976 RepID=UPI0024B7D97B|nr:tRNA-intron lyase [Methanobrevibacter woesei]